MNRERKIAALRDALNDRGYFKGDEFVVFCKNPRGCDGKHYKRKLSINLKTDVFHCWVCGFSGHSIEPILRFKRDSEYYAEYIAEERPEQTESKKIYAPVTLPHEFRALSVPHRSPWYDAAMGYLVKRGLKPSDAFLYKLGYCESGEFQDRVIIPSFDEYGELNFFSGRSLYERTEPKYKNSVASKDIIFNDYMVDWSEPITLVEGPFDMMKIGQNAISIQGVFLPPGSKLFQKIVARHVSVYIALDKDAMSNILKIAEDLMAYGTPVSIVSWNGFKDPGDMPRGKFEDFRPSAFQITSALDLLKIRALSSTFSDRS